MLFVFYFLHLLAYWYLIPISFVFLYFIVYIFIEKRIRRILHKGNAYTTKHYNLEYSGLLRELDEMIRTYSLLLLREREGLKEYYEKFNAIFDSIGSGLLVFNENNILQRSNHKAKEIFHNITLKYGMQLSKIFIKSGIKITLESGIYEVYSKKLRKNLQLIISKKSNFIIIAVNDITTYKKLKKNLENARHFARLGEILANAAHGLKTPIARLKMTFQMYELTNDKNYLNQVKNEIDNIQNIVQETLELFKIPEDIKLFSLNLVINDVINNFKKVYPQIKFIVQDMVNVEIKSDEWLFKSAMFNVIQNSIDAVLMKKDQSIIIVKMLRKKGCYKIMLADNGIGMDKTEKEKYLKPFFTTKDNGTGLGTVFLERFVIFQNARLRVNSIKGKGTIISIILEK
ncbi:sensor histidine kinase [Marinitoga aeolica]|uniref:histidine kinase n=1 Tax=Marinitoga aeolica TaxID=2809031 RepID=A0ABY8PMU9_9BACT|nr:HAMP domain-containing sensor histidine kinase [Marinitoga aeolica]WGS63960.1 HAMP domain-containing histidine kinase [Marinitoga aeolica]